MLKNSDIHIRDPFVLPIELEKKYYLYGTRGTEAWTKSATGIDYYVSDNLIEWDGPFPAFRPPNDFWADRNFWAPEVHQYQGQFYMFITFKADGVRRGTQILRADTPEGPFVPINERPLTPDSWECLDGTLYVDNNSQPWMIFCHEWVQVGDGEICAIPLSPDLSDVIGEAQLLFRASESQWAEELNSKGRKGYVTDGPWMYRMTNGDLLMLWSSFRGEDYTVGMARSTTGDIHGTWEHIEDPLYVGDGGHCMVFSSFEGQLYLAFHRPNGNPNERPYFVPIRENGSVLEII